MNWQILDPQGEPVAVTEEQLRGMLRLGHLKRGTLMWCEGMADWAPAEEARPDLFPSLHHAHAPAGPAPMVVVPPQVELAAPPRARRTVVRRTAGGKTARKSGGGGGLGRVLKVVGVIFLIAMAAAMIRIFMEPKAPGQDALELLEKGLSGSKTGGTGASPGETKAATAFAEASQALRSAGISAGSGSFGRGKSGLMRRAAAGLDGDGFTAVCAVRGDTAVFLLHVPDLRKFADDAKEAMGHMAWFAARAGWQELPEPRPSRLCVGIKGIANYDRVLEGSASAPIVAEDEELTFEKLSAGISRTHTGHSESVSVLSALAGTPASGK